MLRDLLSIEKRQYVLVGHLKNRLLDPALVLINRTTDIRVDYAPYKHGRKIAGFVFDIKKSSLDRRSLFSNKGNQAEAKAENETSQTLAEKYQAI